MLDLQIESFIHKNFNRNFKKKEFAKIHNLINFYDIDELDLTLSNIYDKFDLKLHSEYLIIYKDNIIGYMEKVFTNDNYNLIYSLYYNENYKNEILDYLSVKVKTRFLKIDVVDKLFVKNIHPKTNIISKKTCFKKELSKHFTYMKKHKETYKDLLQNLNTEFKEFKDNFCEFDIYKINLNKNQISCFDYPKIKETINKLINSKLNITLQSIYFNLTKIFSIEEIEENKEYLLTSLYNSYNNFWSEFFSQKKIKFICEYSKIFYNINVSEIYNKEEEDFILNNKYDKILISKGFSYRNKYSKKFKPIKNTYTIEFISDNRIQLTWFKEQYLDMNYFNNIHANQNFVYNKNNFIYYRFLLNYIKKKLNSSKYIEEIYLKIPNKIQSQFKEKLKSITIYKCFEIKKGNSIKQLLPVINKRHIDYFLRLGKFNLQMGEILKEYNIITDYKRTAGSYSYIYNSFIQLNKIIGQENALKYFKKIASTINLKKITNPNGYLHDFCVKINKIINNKYLTKGATINLIDNLIILYNNLNTEDYSELEDLINNLFNLNHYKDVNDALKLRKNISKGIRKNEIKSTNELVQNLIFEIKLEIQKEKAGEYEKILSMNLDSQKVKDYINKLNKYNSNIDIFNLIDIFKENTKNFILGKYKGVFKEDDIYNNTYPEIISIIKNIFSKRNKLAKRLYHDLKINFGVDRVLNQNLNNSEIFKLIEILEDRNIELDIDYIKKHMIYGKIEKKCSPEFLIAGDASVCCMSFGHSNAKNYALEKGFGIFNVYYNNRIIANSVIWINNKDSLIIDNIEVHPNYEKYNNHIENIYRLFIEKMKKDYNFKNVFQGYTYNDLELYSTKKQKPSTLKMNPFEIKNIVYSDATKVYKVG